MIGAGLVGLAVARALVERHPGIDLVVVDKEDEVAAHQSSHNSGVVHSGLYYRPGSLKARLCVEGRRALEVLAQTEAIPYRRTGKLVIATDRSQIGALDELEQRGTANGLIGLERLGPDGIRDHEPEATGVEALHVPEAGVADFPRLAAWEAKWLEGRGARLRTGFAVQGIASNPERATVWSEEEGLEARVVVNCAGLHSDRVATMAGVSSPVRIVPFRGEYYTLTAEAEALVRSLIYPVPDPRFPFLGVHFTRRIDGSVEVGPNAVLALGREHYRGADPDWPEVARILAYPGFRRLAMRHAATGLMEMIRSRSRTLYARAARSLVPSVRRSHLVPGGAGVRAQALDRHGKLVDDFVILEADRTVHVLNAPSPGATASLAIGAHIAARVGSHLTAPGP